MRGPLSAHKLSIALLLGAFLAAASAGGAPPPPPQREAPPPKKNPPVQRPGAVKGKSSGGVPAARQSEAACDTDSGLACEVGQIRVCRNGEWTCVGPARPG